MDEVIVQSSVTTSTVAADNGNDDTVVDDNGLYSYNIDMYSRLIFYNFWLNILGGVHEENPNKKQKRNHSKKGV